MQTKESSGPTNKFLKTSNPSGTSPLDLDLLSSQKIKNKRTDQITTIKLIIAIILSNLFVYLLASSKAQESESTKKDIKLEKNQVSLALELKLYAYFDGVQPITVAVTNEHGELLIDGVIIKETLAQNSDEDSVYLLHIKLEDVSKIIHRQGILKAYPQGSIPNHIKKIAHYGGPHVQEINF